jgi:hypothetical protein
MEAYAVNRAVNSVKNDTEECIEPVAEGSRTGWIVWHQPMSVYTPKADRLNGRSNIRY